MGDYTERTHPRVKVSATIDISGEDLQLFNHIENISLGGACITTSQEPCKLGTEVELTVNFPDNGGELTVVGEVVWCSPVPDSVMGVRFLNLAGETREKLQDYLYNN